MCFYVFWCLLVLFLVFWLYCIITVTPFKRRLHKAGHFYPARGSWTSRNKNAVFSPKSESTANFFSSGPRGKPLFPLWEITRHFAQSARGVEETIQPNNVGSCHLRPCCGSLFPAFRLSRLHLSKPEPLLRKYLQWWDYFDYI